MKTARPEVLSNGKTNINVSHAVGPSLFLSKEFFSYIGQIAKNLIENRVFW